MLWDAGTYFRRSLLRSSMPSLELLFVRQGRMRISAGDEDEVNSSCLTALIVALEIRATNLIQNPEPVDTPVHNSNPPTSIMLAFPCPLLHKITVQLRNPLGEDLIDILLACAKSRRTGGYPLRMLVRCPQINEGVERMLQSQENNDVHVFIIPLQS